MRATIKIPPKDKERFKQVLTLANEARAVTNVSIITEGDDFFEIEYSKDQYLFNLGRAYEPYKIPVNAGSITMNFDNSYIHKI